jgi:hypothetical protein
MSTIACLVCGGPVEREEQRPRPLCAQCRAEGWTEQPMMLGLIAGLRRLVAEAAAALRRRE